MKQIDRLWLTKTLPLACLGRTRQKASSLLSLARDLRSHRKLAEQRSIDLEKNKVAKWFVRFFVGFVVLYLLLFAILLALGANESHTLSSIEFVCQLIPGIFILDFLLRFAVQQTPSQMVKPYVLLPIPKYTCVDFFLAGQMLNTSNLIWMIMLVPYCVMSVLFSFGLLECLYILLVFWLLELCISQFYLIVRTLINDTLLWWLMPIGILLISLIPGADFSKMEYLTSNFSRFYDLGDVFRFYGRIGAGIESHSILPLAGMLLLLLLLLTVNRRIQYSHVISELSRVGKTLNVSGKNRTAFLEELGTVGMFLALEIKTTMRNKNPRKSFIMAISIVVMFSLVIIFTDVYDYPLMANFWCLYDYAIFGAMTLVKIMCNEGNYIDGLMVRKENIYQILRAKYIFNCVVLVLPLVLMLPVVVAGKWSFLMVSSYGVFTAGFQFFLLFQLAVINRTATPLNTRLISKSNIENSKWQIIVEMFCLFVPVAVVSVVQLILGDTLAYVTMLLVGIAFIATHKLWLRNIYNRFMQGRYVNMEGFRASRQ